MHALVTGAAGFIGSHLAERLVSSGWDVRGVDAFTPYYDATIKRANASGLSRRGVDIREADLRSADLRGFLDGVDAVFHFSALPGVRSSWAQFPSYTEHNLLVTQRLLEAMRRSGASRFVFASSSSVYGQVTGSVTEESPTHPYSPYGVTKLAADALCTAYAQNFGVPTVNLRLFTVYGPRQRPDMALHRLIRSSLTGDPFTVLGDGSAVRAFTYVGDVVDAAIEAATADLAPGVTMNISSGDVHELREVIDEVGRAVGRPVPVRYESSQAGDVLRTDAQPDRAADLLGWAPRVTLPDGIAQQVGHLADAGLAETAGAAAADASSR